MRRVLCFCLLAASVLSSGCAEKTPLLEVRLVTGLVAGPEFRIVETQILDADPNNAVLVDSSEARALVGMDFGHGRRVASVELPKGDYRVRVRLRRPSSELLVERVVAVNLANDTVVSVHITRDCVGVICPSPGGDAEASTCLAGRCVDPRCSITSPEFCPTVAFCRSEDECPSTAECAESVCDEGVCSSSPRGDACDDTQWCNPDRGAGCQDLDENDDDPFPCGTICTTPDLPCEFGYWNCRDASEPFCDSLTTRPFGFACAGGRICDVQAMCVDAPSEMSGVVVMPTMGLTTNENGTVATFTVALRTEPTAPVYLTLASSDSSEAVVAPSTLAFTPTNWMTPQLVTVTGIDDEISDGNQPFVITSSNTTSADVSYANLVVDDVHGTNLDDESASVFTTIVGSPFTTEGGGTMVFDLVLSVAPSATVTIDLASSDDSEGRLEQDRVEFSPLDWNTPQHVTVIGVDDDIVDGNVGYSIITSEAHSTDPTYENLIVDDPSTYNADDDVASVIVTPSSGLATTERGTQASFTVVLGSEPTSTVSISFTSSNAAEGTVSPSMITFTTMNWSTPQTVTVTGVDDALTDGNVNYTVVSTTASSSDPVYAGRNVADVSVTNVDDESAGVVFSPSSGLATSESGGTVTVAMWLLTAPSSDVSISVSVDDSSEGTVTPSSANFAPTNWWMPQYFTLAGVNDDVDDGNIVYNFVTSDAVSADPIYSGMVVSDAIVTNYNDDGASVRITPVTAFVPATGLMTTELGGTANVSVVLTSRPLADVNISFVSSDTSEVVLSAPSITFNASNWNLTQTITFTGVNDFIADGNVGYSIYVDADSADPNYERPLTYLYGSNADDEMPNIVVTPSTGLVTTEAGATATFTVVLTTEPAYDVFIDLSSSDLNEGIVSPAILTFTSSNWSTAQTVTITGVDESLDDGDRSYTIVTSALSADSSYSGRSVPDVSVTNVDDDSIGVVVTPTSGLFTNEQGTTATFTVVLTSLPAADVSLSLVSTNTEEGTVSPSSLTFTPMNFNVPQTVTLTGVADLVYDGYVPYTIVTSATSSADLTYNALVVPDVSVVNRNVVTFFKASNTEAADFFGNAISISRDGNTIAIGATQEDSASQTINGNQLDNSANRAGALYVFVRSGATWVQQAYIKASNAQTNDEFGTPRLSADGNTLLVGAWSEASNATGINGDQSNNSAYRSGAMYVFTRSGSTWTQEAYIKASNAEANDGFGLRLELSDDGNTAITSSPEEDSNATGINGNQANNSAMYSGAVYVFVRSAGIWSQQAYIKASNAQATDSLWSIALSGDGNTIVAGAAAEDSNATGVGGNQANNTAAEAGAVYVFTRTGTVWSQQAYIKASNTSSGDTFGDQVAISGDGSTLAVGAYSEDSNATGIDGNQADNSASSAGAIYVFTRVGMTWSQQAYIKPSNTRADMIFELPRFSYNGNLMAVGAPGETSNATNIGGNQSDASVGYNGAVYLFERTGSTWSQIAYVKAPVAMDSNYFGSPIDVSGDGRVVLIGSSGNASASTGIDGDLFDTSAGGSGAVFAYYP